MDFKDLSYILAIEKCGNITKAAEALYLSQPSLSRFLQNMEREAGQPLFRRVGNRYIPTYMGERYLEHARVILQEKKELDQEVNDIIKSNRGVLKIGFPTMRCTYMLPCTLPIFRKMYPNVKIEIYEANSSQLNRAVIDGDIDLAFYNFFEKHPNIDYTLISHEEMVLMLSAKSDLLQKGTQKENCKYPCFDLKDLGDTGIIMLIPEQRTRQIAEQILKEAQFTPNIILETSNIPAAAELAARNYGVTFITETHLKHLNLRNEYRCFSVGSPCTYIDFVAAYRKNSYLSTYAQEYIEIVRDFT